jgi:hypothetical protein
MPDLEALLVKIVVITLAALSAARLIWQEFNNLMNDLRRKRKQR